MDALEPLVVASYSNQHDFEQALKRYLEVVDPNTVVQILRGVFEDPAVQEVLEQDLQARGLDYDTERIVETFLEAVTGVQQP